MLDCQVAILENATARHAATGDVPGPIGARHPSITPFDAFKAADGHLIRYLDPTVADDICRDPQAPAVPCTQALEPLSALSSE